MNTKELKQDIQEIKDKVRKPLTHREKLLMIKELIDDWAKNHKEPINANDVYNWVKFGFVAGA